MNTWRVEYITGHSVSRFKIIKADSIRMSKFNGDLWFCNNGEMDEENNHLPKMILAKGSYLGVERVEPKEDTKEDPIVVDLSEKVKKEVAKHQQYERDNELHTWI